jgi:hypothetical protein
MPYIYALILAAEAVGLTWRYATDAPSPSSPLGQFLGWGAIASMTVLLVYSVARRSRALRQMARLSYWLHFHIFLAVQGVMWAFFHASHVFTKAHVSWLNPGFLDLMAVGVVFSSGIFGRYLYAYVPRHETGEAIDGAPLVSLARVFSWWIVLHRPLAAALYLLSVMHILLSYMFTAGR